MAAPFWKLAITLLVLLAWRSAGASIEPVALRRRLAWGFGLALLLRVLLGLGALAGEGGRRNAATILAAVVGLALVWPLLQLALAGPLSKPGRITRIVFTLIGLIVLWGAGPGASMFLFWIAFTRCAWPRALGTSERFRASLAALVAGLALLLGVHQAAGLSKMAEIAEGVAWFARGLGLVYALWAATAAFKAFTQDPTLGVRRVSRRLVLSHVLVVTVPLVIVLALWVSSTYLGVNADRALMTVRALDREGGRLEESLGIALRSADPAAGVRAVGDSHSPGIALRSADPAAGVRAMADSRLARWPGLRVFVVSESTVTRVVGAPLAQESKLVGWVAKLDSLRRHGIVELGRSRYLGAAVRTERIGLVALEPIDEAFDSTLSPLMGAEVRMATTGHPVSGPGMVGVDFENLADSLHAAALSDREIDSLAHARAEHVARILGQDDTSRFHVGRGTRPARVTVDGDTVAPARGSIGFTGYALVEGVERDAYAWKSQSFLLSARASLKASLVGLFANVRENPPQVVPIVALAFLAFLLLPLANTDLKMVRGMGGSITRGIAALREGAEAFGDGKLAHRIPIAGDDDLWDTARQFNLMAEGLEHARELEKERDRLENELELARRIQARLLPASAPSVPGFDVAGLSESAREVGGDYYDHIELGSGRVLLVIADVSGKGVPAALLMSGFRASLMSQDIAGSPPDAVAARANEFLYKSVEPGKFVTAFLGVIDGATGRLTYVNAGHNPPVLLRSDGGIELLEAGGLILGIMPETRFTSGEATLAPGDLVALYTDGVTEGADASNEQWGEERLVALLRSVAGAGPGTASPTARDIATRIVREVRAFEGERGPADDITVLVARRVAPASA